MAGRRSCVNSLWSGTERVRIGERLKATLAGVLELELLRCKHLDMVDGALEVGRAAGTGTVHRGAEEGATENLDGCAATPRRQQTSSHSDVISPPCQGHPVEKWGNQGDGPVHSRTGGFGNSRWSTLSWDASSDLLSPPTLDSNGMIQMDSDSRPSSGFYSVSGSSLSDSCYSVSSEAALGLPGLPQAKPPRQGEQTSVPGDPSEPRWAEGTGRQQPVEQSIPEDAGDLMGRGVVSGDFETAGLGFLSDLCSSLSDPRTSTLVSLLNPLSTSSSSLHLRAQLDLQYCTDLVSRRTKEVYSYPSPLHAVALQSPLFIPQGLESSASTSPEAPPLEESPASASDPDTSPAKGLPNPPSLTQLEQYISRLAHQYQSRDSASTSDLTLMSTPGPAAHTALRTPSKGHGSTQSLSAFESHISPSPKPLVGSATPCKSLMGNSAKVSLSSIGKRASRNSINFGNLPSATGEDLNISLHLNLNLNLAPDMNGSLRLGETTKNDSCGALRNDLSTASSMSTTSLTSTSTPGLRARSRISTCPSTLSHRSSLEVAPATGATPTFGSQNFCHSLDWSSSVPLGAAGLGIHPGSASGSQRSSLNQDLSSSPMLSEESAMVEEIVRLSGLSRAVVVGLMEQGVELDVDCFQADPPGTRPRSQGHQAGYPYRTTSQADHSHPRLKMRCTSVDAELNPQRPMQLSLSVTHSPQSHSGLTPPPSHSPRSQASLTPPLSHANSPIHPYHSAHPAPALQYPSLLCSYQQTAFPSDLPSSTASSPASRPLPRGHSPPRPLQPSPLGSTPLSVFRRDAPFQCSLPRGNASAPAPVIRPRGGSLRQGAEAAGGGSGGWRRSEGEGLYRGKHASRELIRASTVSSYAHRENYSFPWGEDEREGESRHREASASKRTSGRLWRGWDGRLWGRESENEKEEMDRAEYGYGWSRNGNGSWRKDGRRQQPMTGSCKERRPTVDSSPSSSRAKGKGGWEKRSSSLRFSSRRTLFRSESQGLLVPRARHQEPMRATPWVSSLDVARCGLGLEDGVRPLEGEADKRLSSTTSLFNLSRSQSLEGSCQSLSPPLSSPSFSPSPPPRTLQRSRSLRDLGKRVFGSMRSLSLKKKSSKK